MARCKIDDEPQRVVPHGREQTTSGVISDGSTEATETSDEDQATPACAISWPCWSRTSAASCAVCPSAVSATASGVTAMVLGAGATTTSKARPVTPAAVAATSASPAPTPVARSASSTTATSVSLDAQSNSALTTGCPLESAASAARRSVSVAGETATALTSWATVTVALPDAEPAVAVIVAVPLPAAVASPELLTVATAAALLAQLTAAPAIALPFWSRTSAVNCSVAPNAVSRTVAGDRAERLEDRSRLLNGGWRCRIRLGFTPRHCRPSGGGSGSSGALRGLGLPPGREKGPRIERDPFQTDRARPAMSAAICRRRTISGLLSRVRDTVQEALARDS